MTGHSTSRPAALIGLIAVLSLVGSLAANGAAARNASPSPEPQQQEEYVLPGDTSTPFWPYETGVRVGTSETYEDVRQDGSYFDPSIGQRVAAR